MWESCQSFYASDVQGLYAVLVVPALFLVWLAGPGRRRAAASSLPDAGVILAYCAVFGLETLLDPVATGPLGGWLDLAPATRTGVQFLFVFLGDLRVFLLVMALAGLPHALLRALAWTCVVPAVAGAVHFGLQENLWPGLPGQTLWLAYELAFAALALWLRARPLPRWTTAAPPGRARFLERCLAYAAVYYALWAASDVLILAGVDAGWALRVLPNQLYYAFWVPFVYFAFFGRGSPVAASARGSYLA